MFIRCPLFAFFFAAVGCGPGAPPAATVPGAQINTLTPPTTGYVVMEQPRGGIVAVQLPSLKETIIRRAAAPEPIQIYFAMTHGVSGPDENGRIAYIEDHFVVKDPKDE